MSSKVTAEHIYMAPCCGFIYIDHVHTQNDPTMTIPRCTRDRCLGNKPLMNLMEMQSHIGSSLYVSGDATLSVAEMPFMDRELVNPRYVYLTCASNVNHLTTAFSNIQLADGVSSSSNAKVFSMLSWMNDLRKISLCEKYISRKRKLEESVYTLEVELKAARAKLASLEYDHNEKHVQDHKDPLGDDDETVTATDQYNVETEEDDEAIPLTPVAKLKSFKDVERE